MTQAVSGGCKCSAVRYQGQSLDAPGFRCHCRDCQQLTGTGHSEMFPLDRTSFEISATCKTYEMTGGSGKSTYSGFCPECGSQIFRRSERSSDRLYVYAGSLDDPASYAPKRSIYIESAQVWDDGIIPDDTRK